MSLAYVALVLGYELSATLSPTYEGTLERRASVVDALGRISDVRLRPSIDVSTEWLDAVEEPEQELERPSHMIFSERPAAETHREEAPLVGRRVPASRADRRTGGTGKRARLREGPIGNPSAPITPGLWAIGGTGEAPSSLAKTWSSPRFARPVFATIGPVASGGWGFLDDDPGKEQIAADWGEDDAASDDDNDILGNMFGPEPIDPRGVGLGAAGFGPGGGADARSIGLGRAGNLGHGSGTGRGQGVGVPDATPFGRDARTGRHEPRSPTLVTRFALETIERVMRRNGGRFAACRRAGGADALVDVSFSITVDGIATEVVFDRAEPAPPLVETCLRRVLSELRFLPAASAPARVVRWRLPVR